MHSRTTFALLVLAFSAPAAPRLLAQGAPPLRIVCPVGFADPETACTGEFTANDLQQTREVRIQVVATASGAAVPSAVVRFRTLNGYVLPDSTQTDPAGFASTVWYRNRSSDPAGVTVEARTRDGSAMRLVRLAPPPDTLNIAMTPWRYSRGWFEKNPLPSPVVMQIHRTDGQALTRAACSSQRVAFTRVPGTGTVSPDTSTASIYGILPRSIDRLLPDPSAKPDSQCLAVTSWTLGEGAGIRAMRATLVPGGRTHVDRGATYLLETRARALPRLIGGVLASWQRSYTGVKPGKDRVVRIERILPDGSKMAFDTTFSGTAGVDTVGGKLTPAAFVGVSSAIVPSWTWLSLTAGVDIKNPQYDWYAGVSLLRAARGLSTEGLPIDLHLLAHFGRSQVLRNVQSCEQRIRCDTRDQLRFHGLGAMVSIDAASLFSDLIKKIGT